jgi:iron complex transport system substrate-binding protein
MPEHRIVTLIASATEIVCALGFRNQLVGRSHECDFPASVATLPVCTEPKLRTDLSSREIDAQVKRILTEALSVYRVDAEKLRALQPTVVVTQSQCEVCAVSLRDVEAALCDWLDSRPQIVSLEPNSLADVWNDIRRTAAALRAPERGERLDAHLRQRMLAIAERARSINRKPTVACIEWIDPLMAAGNWMPELVEMAGGINLFGLAGKHSPWTTWDDLRAKDPDVVIVLPCGFDIPRTREEMPALARQPGWLDLRAVREQRVFLADGNQYFNRPGPRLAESLEILAELLHPSVFSFGHHNRGWEHF